MIEFKILKQSKKSRARLGVLKTPHGEVRTPALVPVATLAALAADVGLNEVNCAVVAFSDLESALETAGTGSGVTPKATNVALTNADAYIAKHGLRSAASK